MKTINEIEGLDCGIAPAVKILNDHGFITFESCEGGNGHIFSEPTIRFYGSEFDLIRAFEVCQCYRLNVYEAKRVFIKQDIFKNKIEKGLPVGSIWNNPFNELIFAIHSKTKTIFLPD